MINLERIVSIKFEGMRPHNIFKNTKRALLINGLKYSLINNIGRRFVLNSIYKNIREYMIEDEKSIKSNSKYISDVRSQFVINLLKQAVRNIEKNYLSKEYVERFIENLVMPLIDQGDSKIAIERYKEKYGTEPPMFVTISPYQYCNLRCVGCYAASLPEKNASLSYEVVRRVIKEMHDIAGSRFIVISGGEPFLWRDDNKDIISLAEEFSDMFFLVYTNGTVLDDSRCKRLLNAANMTPAISIEGYEEETDRRRGRGIFKKILRTIDKLKEHGILFGLSITATKENVDILLDDKFYDYWFEDVGATYIWMFHLMPIGRAKDTMSLMVTPEQRVKLLLQWEHLLLDKGYFVGDFWNGGAATRGCIGYGRAGGYFYIDWNGNIMPCVFVPYYKDNLYQIYEQGKSVFDALQSDLFLRGRKWQKDYGYMSESPKNFFTPCSIRDNYKDFREVIMTNDTRPEDENAKNALEDPEYYSNLVKFGEELKKKTDTLWAERMSKKIIV